MNTDGSVSAGETDPRLNNIINASFGLECKSTGAVSTPATNTCDVGYFFKITSYNYERDDTRKIIGDEYNGRCCKPVSKNQL